MENKFNIEGFDTFEKLIIDFSATWCGPCKALNPILDEITDEGGIKIFKIDVDANQGLAVEHGIRSIPTLLFFRKGKLIKQLQGMQNKETILKVFS